MAERGEKMANVLAIFNLSNSVPRPKINGVTSSYSPHHKFSSIPWLASGRHQYKDDSRHYPGESLITTITFVSWEYICKNIKSGDTFEVREGGRMVGQGKIITIFNEDKRLKNE